MRKQIRQSVFETNSSSTHSISIANVDPANLMESMDLDSSNNVVIYGQEFGWEVQDYNDAETKAAYLAQYCQQWYPNDKIGNKTLWDILVEIIQDQTACNEVILDDKDAGYIDHQSVESADFHYLFREPDKLRQFIFDGSSWLHTDNDNY
jgi:hypothetical protein